MASQRLAAGDGEGLGGDPRTDESSCRTIPISVYGLSLLWV